MHTLPRLAIGFLLFSLSASTLANCTIYVTHNGDANAPFWTFTDGSNNQMLLREAVEVGKGDARCYTSFEKDRIVGGNFVNDPVFCGTFDNSRNWRLSVGDPGCGPNNADTVQFWDNINGGTQINLGAQLMVDPRDSIDGAALAAGARTNIALVGPGPGGPTSNTGAIVFDLFSSVPASGSVRNLYIDNFRGKGVWAQRVNGLSIKGVVFSRISTDQFGFAYGVVLGEYSGPEAGGYCVFGAQIGGTGSGEQNYFYDIAYTAISIWDTCSGDSSDRNNKIFNNYIGMCEELDTGFGLDGCPNGTPNPGIGQRGIRILETPNTRIGGSGVNEGNFVARSAVAGIVLSGTRTRDTRVLGNVVGLSRTGLGGRGNGEGIQLTSGALQNQIGDVGVGAGNVISSNTLHGVVIGVGDGNSVSGNIIGLNAARTQLRGNGSDGVAVHVGATGAVVRNNVIAGNSGQGVYLGGSSGALVEGNVIGLRGFSNNSNDNTASGNAQAGIWIDSGANNVVGVGNRIAANGGAGVRISGEGADGSVLKGSVIGLSAGGDLRPNAGGGVLIHDGADGATIGGANSSDRNIISANTGAGVRVVGPDINGLLVRGNYIGTFASGSGDAGNSGRGVQLEGAVSEAIIALNIISGNGGDGLALIGVSGGPQVQGNIIGLDFALAALPNASAGVALLSGTTGATIGGGTVPNTIAGNANFGVFVADPGTINNTIIDNVIGSSVAGRANGAGGITLRASANNNIVSNNTVIGHSSGPGIEIINADNNNIRGNRVGLTSTGAAAGNQAGVRVVGGASANTIGGTVSERNYIGGNALYGITFAESNTSDNVASNNYIGVDLLGTTARPNALGVLIEGAAHNNVITQNLISGNSSDGVWIKDNGSISNVVQRNRIGLAPTGTAIVGNAGNGIRISGNANSTFIGGLPAQANVISGNAGAGVRIESGVGNDLNYNSIFGNTGLGIDLGGLGVTPNDVLDADTGANGLQNFPGLSNVLQNGAMVSMTVTQNGLASTSHGIVFYANSGCDPSGNGEGEVILNGVALSTNASGLGTANVMLPLPSAALVPRFSATSSAAVAAGQNTSEFSPCVVNGALLPQIFASGFEAVNQIIAQEKTEHAHAQFSSIERVDENNATLSLVLDNATVNTLPAHSFSIVSDRGVIVESIETQGIACALLGAIVCEVPALKAGQRGTVVIGLRVGPDALTMTVSETDKANKSLRRRQFMLMPY